MRKNLPIFIIIVTILLGFLPFQVKAEESYIDQENTGVNESSAAYKIYGRYTGELFVPTVNRITRADVFIRYPVTGAWLGASLVKGSTGETIATSGTRMAAHNDWEIIGFGEVEVEPGVQYFLYLNIDNPSYNTMWVRTSTNTYDIGVLTVDGDLYGDRDFGFKIWGYTFSEEEPPPEEEEEEEGEEESEDPGELPETGDEDTDEESTTNEPNDNTYTVDSKDADEAIVDENETVEEPVLEYVKKNEEEVEDTGLIEVESVDTITIGGSSFADAKVVIIIGDTAYEVTADGEGKWSIIVDMKDLEAGEYTVQAQAINAEGKGSKIADLFDLKLSSNRNTIDWPKAEEVEYTLWQKLTVGSLRYISMIILGLILVGLITLLLIIVAKNEKKEKEPKKKDQKKFEHEDPKKENAFRQNLMQEAQNKKNKKE